MSKNIDGKIVKLPRKAIKLGDTVMAGHWNEKPETQAAMNSLLETVARMINEQA